MTGIFSRGQPVYLLSPSQFIPKNEDVMPTVPVANGSAPREPRPRNPLSLKRAAAGFAALGAGAAWTLPAEAHVKWFAPYIVNATPQPIGATLANQWFWTGIGLVLAFFLATHTIERTVVGKAVLSGLDRSALRSGAARTTSCARPLRPFSSRSSRSAAFISRPTSRPTPRSSRGRNCSSRPACSRAGPCRSRPPASSPFGLWPCGNTTCSICSTTWRSA